MELVAFPFLALAAFALLMALLSSRQATNALADALARHIPSLLHGIVNALRSAALSLIDSLLTIFGTVAIWTIRLFAIPAQVAEQLLAWLVSIVGHARTVSLYLHRQAIPNSTNKAQRYAASIVAAEAARAKAHENQVAREATADVVDERARARTRETTLHNEITTTGTIVLRDAHRDAISVSHTDRVAIERELALDMSKSWTAVKGLVGVTGAGLAAAIAANTAAIARTAEWIESCGQPACNLANQLSPFSNLLKNLAVDGIIAAVVAELISDPSRGAALVEGMGVGGFRLFEDTFGKLLNV